MEQKETDAFFKVHFRGNVDLDVMDLSQLVGAFWPSMTKSSLADLMQASKLKKYAREAPTAVDTLQSIFSAYIIHTLQSQGLLNERMFQLAALGTIADLMPLKDENRLIVRKGIEGINRAPTGGIRELKVSMNLAKPLEAIDIAWQITPTLNAAGRLGTPGLALNLLQADMVDHAMEAASQLIQANNERRRLGTEGWDIVRDKLNESLEQHGGKFAVVGSAEIKSGITGLLASRAANMMKVPVIVVAFKADGTCSGSIRSAAAFPLTNAPCPLCGPFFGLRRARLRRGLYPQDRPMAGLPNPSLRVHGPHRIQHRRTGARHRCGASACVCEAPSFSISAVSSNPLGRRTPRLSSTQGRSPMVDAQVVGKNGKSHLKLTLDFGAYKWPAMLWDGAERLERDFSFRNKDKVDILYKVTTNYWNGEERPQIELYDIRRAED